MDATEITELLEKLEGDKNVALAGSVPNAPVINLIVNQLNSLAKEDRSAFKDFAKLLKTDCFKQGVTIKNLKSDFFDSEKTALISSYTGISQSNKDDFSKVQSDLKEMMNTLSSVLAVDLEVLKDHFLIKLETNPLVPYKLMVLHDSTFFVQPIKQKLDGPFPDVLFKEIEDYSEDMQKGKEKTNLLCLILLNSRTNDDDKIKELIVFLTNIIESYESFENISIKFTESVGYEYDGSNLKDDFFDEVKFVNGTLLSNGKIKHEEEKIIKKLCSNFNTPLIIYKSLKEGNSGAKVIEVRPKKQFGSEHERRYIIKYSEKDDERKIRVEKENFGLYIDGYKGFSEYECKYEKTLFHDGLRYSYAISDEESVSYSYHEILNNVKGVDGFDKKDTITNLFQIEIFNRWKESAATINCKTNELYKEYINFEKTLDKIGEILNLTREDLVKEQLYIDFEKIWNFNFNFRKKVCHGDLHSENFFIDNQGIYLIDFGYTGEKHALIDHTSLECSLRFKHIPLFIPSDELEAIDQQFLTDNSFNVSNIVKGTSRKKIIELFEIIQQIRHNSVGLIVDNTSKIEYFISLYIMTFRQIRYDDMNQRYALESARRLGDFLTKTLNL